MDSLGDYSNRCLRDLLAEGNCIYIYISPVGQLMGLKGEIRDFIKHLLKCIDTIKVLFVALVALYRKGCVS